MIPIRAKLQGPGVRRAISAKLGLNFNPGFFFLFKSIFQDNFLNSFKSVKSSNCAQKNKTEFAFKVFIAELKFCTNPGL